MIRSLLKRIASARDHVMGGRHRKHHPQPGPGYWEDYCLVCFEKIQGHQ